jgi:hypothetical protein
LGNQCSFIPGSYFRDPEESATRVEGRRSPPGPSARTTDSVGLQSARPRLRTLLPRSGPRSYRPCPAAPRSDGAHTPLPSFRRASSDLMVRTSPQRSRKAQGRALYRRAPLCCLSLPTQDRCRGEPRSTAYTSTIRLLISNLAVITLRGEESRCHGTRVLTWSGSHVPRACTQADTPCVAQHAGAENKPMGGKHARGVPTQ